MAADGSAAWSPPPPPRANVEETIAAYAFPFDDAKRPVSSALGELADLAELLRVVATSVNLGDDDTLQNAFDRTCFRMQKRAEMASKLAVDLENDAREVARG